MDDLKSALSALTNRTVKVEFPSIEGIYVRPLPLKINMSLLAEAEGEGDEEQNDNYHIATLAYCMVNEDGEQIFSKDEFKVWYDKADSAILAPLQQAVNSLNDFSGKSTESKKK
jgi:hypothetical protein